MNGSFPSYRTPLRSAKDLCLKTEVNKCNNLLKLYSGLADWPVDVNVLLGKWDIFIRKAISAEIL